MADVVNFPNNSAIDESVRFKFADGAEIVMTPSKGRALTTEHANWLLDHVKLSILLASRE